jgi:Ni,Fe-hydrogenase maturation factor
MKILCLGNEFIKIDSLAKEIGKELKKIGYVVININNSFELIDYLQENNDIVILDVVLGINCVKILKVEELKVDSIVSAHDFDAGFLLKLMGESKTIKIIGVPIKGDKHIIINDINKLLIKN